jgi:hypothetical protein
MTTTWPMPAEEATPLAWILHANSCEMLPGSASARCVLTRPLTDPLSNGWRFSPG